MKTGEQELQKSKDVLATDRQKKEHAKKIIRAEFSECEDCCPVISHRKIMVT